MSSRVDGVEQSIESHEILILIPARAGSVGIPGKNTVDLGGKPLVLWSIEQALRTFPRNQVHVSSDDSRVLDIARSAGAIAVSRSPDLATSEASTMDVIREHLNAWPEYRAVILLQPTSPLRAQIDIQQVAESLLLGEESVVTVTKVEHPIQWSCVLEEGRLEPLFGKGNVTSRRQDLSETFRPNGAVFGASRSFLEANESFLVGGTLAVVMPAERSIDIDTDFDLSMARLLVEREA